VWGASPVTSSLGAVLIAATIFYEQISGGSLCEVRSNVTLPAVESNLACVGPMNTSAPSWYGLPQPGGGFPLPSDKGCFARQKVPLILAHSIPQWVYSSYARPACVCGLGPVDELICVPQPATEAAAATHARRRIIRPHYASASLSSHAWCISPAIGD
jgi:hypothetical protein